MVRKLIKAILLSALVIALYLVVTKSILDITAALIGTLGGCSWELIFEKLFPSKFDGALQIDSSNEEKDIYRLELETDLDELKSKKKIVLEVQNDVILQ